MAVLYTEHLWFGEIGYTRVFWTRLIAAFGVRFVATLLAGALIYVNLALVLRRLGPVRLRRRYGNIEIAEQVPRLYVTAGALLVSVFGGWWLATLQFGGEWPLQVWAWLRHEPWGVAEPLFGRDLSFYVFTLPILLRSLDHILVALFWSLLLVAIGYSLIGAVRVEHNRFEIDPYARRHFAGVAAAFLCFMALRFVAARYAVAVHGTGFNGAVGYTDVHARLSGQWALAGLAIVAAAALVYSARRSLWAPAAAGIGLFAVGVGIFVYAWPAVVQQLQVQPNQLSRERPYIAWNLEFTRRAFGLDAVERAPLTYEAATTQTWTTALPMLRKLALWDVDQLQDGYTQVQSFRGYYGFTDVDFDRYRTSRGVEQVGVGVREFQQQGLDESARTWYNLHLRPEFTRGYGAVAARVNVAVGGAPEYLLSDMTPIQVAPSAANALAHSDPSIYYGEHTTDYIVLGGEEENRTNAITPSPADTASGADPQYSALPAPDSARSGVPIGSFLRVLAFAWRFGDHNLLFTRNLDSDSRILFHRTVRERVQRTAPFFSWDADALPVIVDGRVKWVLDGYTASATFPMSSRRVVKDIGAVNYMRGSVKATVDAVTGEIAIYATDQGDPILRSYAAMFPALIRPAGEMPAWLVEHLRYPALLLQVQADVLQQYHVSDANSFYSGQDAWQVPPQGATRGTPRPNEPLYLMLAMPGDAAPQYVSMLPFIARERQNLTAMLIARNDAPGYGRLMLLGAAADDQIKGPLQVQSIIEQDPEISQQLSLWRQMGTSVELGQLRIVPTGNSVLYIEPLFLAAQEKPIPQLHRVLVSDGISVAMGETLERAIVALHADALSATSDTQRYETAGQPDPRAGQNIGLPPAGTDWPVEALRLYDEAGRHLRNGDFAAFGSSWQRLREVLQRAAQQSGGQGAQRTGGQGVESPGGQ